MTRRIIMWACAAGAALACASPAAAVSSDASTTAALPPAAVAEDLFSTEHGVVETERDDIQIDNQNPDGSPLGVCWGKELLRSKGTWPYTRRLYLYTVWCGHAGVITYRASSARTDHDWACWNQNPPAIARTAGGAGWGMVEVQAWVEVSCHSPTFWPTFNDSLMLRVQYYPWGGYATVAWD